MHFQGVLGSPDFLATRALILDACHDVAVLCMAPHAALQTNELATGLTEEPVLHRRNIVLYEGIDVATYERPHLAAPPSCKMIPSLKAVEDSMNMATMPTLIL